MYGFFVVKAGINYFLFAMSSNQSYFEHVFTGYPYIFMDAKSSSWDMPEMIRNYIFTNPLPTSVVCLFGLR